MKYILLCGGMGRRTNHYSLPKPLNYIYGRHMIEYLIENIPSEEIYIIYNLFLDEYQFQTIVRNKCKTKTLHFSAVEYMTRGAVETAYVGIQQFLQPLNSIQNENIVFIDNDNLHTFPTTMPVFFHDFIGYSIDYHKTNYSFICTDPETGKVTDIAEKQKISDYYCCGFYGFQNLPHFLSLAKELLDANEKTKNEFYFSQLYKHSLDKRAIVEPFFIEHTQHLGTYEEILTQSLLTPQHHSVSKSEIQKKKLRFCFDLDNTLVSYPVVPGDYSTVQPITKTIQTVRQLKQEGHEIVIYTARRMATHHHNVGKVVRDIGKVTMETLEKLGIPYDELIFGKPIADVYVDDRAINPYSQSLNYFGFFMQEEDFLPNKVKNNKYNHIERRQQDIFKTGPKRFMRGELFYYQHIPNSLIHYFPRFLGFSEIKEHKTHGNKEGVVEEEKIQLHMEYIQGIPLYYLYKNQLLTTRHIDQLFDILDVFHSFKIKEERERGSVNSIQREDITANYYDKLASRFLEHMDDYPFENNMTIYHSTISGLQTHEEALEQVDVIHGDFWFSNILLTYDDQYKCIDMRGQVNGKLTLGGDRYYDYGKMYQSILGYDLLLNGVSMTDSWKDYRQTMETHFWKKIEERGKSMEYTKAVTKSLIFGVFHSLHDISDKTKSQIWNLIENIENI